MIFNDNIIIGKHLNNDIGIQGVMEAVGRWKEREGDAATLASFLQILQVSF